MKLFIKSLNEYKSSSDYSQFIAKVKYHLDIFFKVNKILLEKIWIHGGNAFTITLIDRLGRNIHLNYTLGTWSIGGNGGQQSIWKILHAININTNDANQEHIFMYMLLTQIKKSGNYVDIVKNKSLIEQLGNLLSYLKIHHLETFLSELNEYKLESTDIVSKIKTFFTSRQFGDLYHETIFNELDNYLRPHDRQKSEFFLMSHHFCYWACIFTIDSIHYLITFQTNNTYSKVIFIDKLYSFTDELIKLKDTMMYGDYCIKLMNSQKKEFNLIHNFNKLKLDGWV